MSAEARRAWAQNLIQRADGPVPPYGSPAWLMLPEGHPSRIASVIVAAEAWATDGDELERRLRTEVLALSRANKQAEDAEYVAQMRTGHDRRPDTAEIEAEFWEWVRGAPA